MTRAGLLVTLGRAEGRVGPFVPGVSGGGLPDLCQDGCSGGYGSHTLSIYAPAARLPTASSLYCLKR